MTTYHAPVTETMFILRDVLRIQDRTDIVGFDAEVLEVGEDMLRLLGNFSEEVLHPLNAIADEHGCVRGSDGSVHTPPGFPDAYSRFVQGGWPGVAGPEEHGGGGMPLVLAAACYEYLWSANPAFTMSATSLGHAKILLAHGSEELRRTYVSKLVTGEWTGAMGLTEPQAGSDLNLVRTRATARDDGTYSITGSKMFITGGDHDLAPNIIHLVLARLPDAPDGTRGLSLFLVPKFIPDADGRPGQHNGISAGHVEHKMGLHGSPTCQMNYDDATGFLVGEPHHGLSAMFLLMNDLRLMTAAAGVGVSEVAYQNAAAYTKQRIQGKAPSRSKTATTPADPIIDQPDVRRQLLIVRAFTEAARALLLWTALQSDIAERSTDTGQSRRASDRLALLTPVVKGFFTEVAFDNAVIGQQLFGGHGYITETGIGQFVRDIRMAVFGEGVTPIQAMDLVRRKLPLDGGRTVRDVFEEIQAAANESALPADEVRRPMTAALDDLRTATEWITQCSSAVASAVAVHYLELFGQVCLGWMWTRMAGAAPGLGSSALYAKVPLARFFLSRLPLETARQLGHMRADLDTVLTLPTTAF